MIRGKWKWLLILLAALAVLVGLMALETLLGSGGFEEDVVERETLRGAIAALPDRERQVVALRYGRGMTQTAAARVLGVSQVQVSRLERRALERLRRELE